jgi:5-methylcytosine-specific restriction endonuclease McrA
MIDATTRRLVRERAGHRCEYCGLAQAQQPFAAFHIDHIIAQQHGGTDDPENLALACYHCNVHKGTNLTGIDPDSEVITPLFHPRRDAWDAHFAVRDAVIVGRTATGRTTVRVLAMNAADRVQLRRALHDEPPPFPQ